MSTQNDAAPGMGRASTRLRLILAVFAGLCWAGVISLLGFGDLGPATAWFAPQRLLFGGLLGAAAVLTFAPLEYGLKLRGLTVEGFVGSVLLFGLLTFVPAPRGGILDLPDLPLYILLLLAILISTAAVARPFVSAIGSRIFRQRARAYDSRRVRRQSYEIGILLAAVAALAGLRVLHWVSLLLLATALVIAELIFLSLFSAES